MTNDDDGLTPEETRALGALRSGAAPPAALEEATLARLRAEGLVRRPAKRSALPRILAAAAALALFAAGLAVGRRSVTATPAAASADSAPRFVLFLYDAPDEPAMSDAQMQQRVSEYRNWAIGLRGRGATIQGEKLRHDAVERLGPAAPGEAPLGGYFVISAKDWDAAVEVARSCPHLKHGGTIEVRQIEKT
jgi:hypothetical protein